MHNLRLRACAIPFIIFGTLCALPLRADVPPEVEATRRSLAPEATARRGDGVYGRLDGDLDLGLELGIEYQRTVAPAVGVKLWYFWTVGLSAAHVLDLGEDRRVMERTMLGLELRPLFLPRWSADLEAGPAFLDLALDSLALGVAAHLPHESGGDPGAQLSLSGSLPLLAQAAGPWLDLRIVHRFPSATANGTALLVGLSWHLLFDSGMHADP